MKGASRTAVLVCQGRAVAHGRLAPGRFDDPTAMALLRDDERAAVGRARSGVAPRAMAERMGYEMLLANAVVMVPLYDLDVAFTNSQAERDLRPTKLHRKISGCFRSQHGAERFAHLRSYLSTTRTHDVPAIDALVRLFNGDPWMAPAPSATCTLALIVASGSNLVTSCSGAQHPARRVDVDVERGLG